MLSTSRVRCFAMMEFVVFIIGTCFQIVGYGVVPRYASERIRYESYRIGVIDLLGLRRLTLALNARLFWMMEEYGLNTVLRPLVLARAKKSTLVRQMNQARFLLSSWTASSTI